MLTTIDITNKKFEKKMGGYKAVEVNSFLVEVSATISQLNRENVDLKRKLDTANKKLAEYETEHDTLSQALLNAHRMAETVVKDAQAKADLTVRYAEIRAEKISDKVRESLATEQDEFVKLKKEIAEFRSNILDTYKKHIELILSIPTQSTAELHKNDINSEHESGTENNNIVEQVIQANDAGENNIPLSIEPVQTDTVQQEQKKETTFKLNLKFDDETGEYVPTDTDDRHTKLQNLKFGADYDSSIDEDEKKHRR